MESYRIDGGIPLRGEYRVRGAKNAALPIMAATVCRAGTYELHDCPKISDVYAMEKILKSLGAHTAWKSNCLVIDSSGISGCEISEEMMQGMRSSMFLLGSLMTRCGEAIIHRPGGCRIGKRPIDIHINGLESLGFRIEEKDGRYHSTGTGYGGRVSLAYPSVGATENIIMAALGSKGDTLIENCAKEPEIVDFAQFLTTCGFSVRGAGTDRIFIKGKDTKLSSRDVMYFIMEDRIEAATYMTAVLGTGGSAVFHNVTDKIMQSVLIVLERMGAHITSYDNAIEVSAPLKLTAAGRVATAPYPGFPTDCQPQLLTLATQAEGQTTICEEIFESRFTHKKELIKMGANIEICGKNAIINGRTTLNGSETEALDLRGGAALVTAALMAEGTSTVNGIEHIARGYESFEKGIQSLGGHIERQGYEKTQKAGKSVS